MIPQVRHVYTLGGPERIKTGHRDVHQGRKIESAAAVGKRGRRKRGGGLTGLWVSTRHDHIVALQMMEMKPQIGEGGSW